MSQRVRLSRSTLTVCISKATAEIKLCNVYRPLVIGDSAECDIRQPGEISLSSLSGSRPASMSFTMPRSSTTMVVGSDLTP
jgi:hypothetical protein